ncbi:hypothetical protein SAMN05421578_1065 [Paenibacillus macquariensis]|uniref:Teichoic acid D-Ala incorporation-associated protein DltX n=1 Tax=Paenibacillus macquariensis TaxID=948756 RepID=A0ABY1JYW6_9BACL|nr:hypothetical protein SAMN05421578_1065 [Paenibacillus macquariensis]
MKAPLYWIKVQLNLGAIPFNILYWLLLIAFVYVVIGIYGMNWSYVPFQ